jgi:hypothetical protein
MQNDPLIRVVQELQLRTDVFCLSARQFLLLTSMERLLQSDITQYDVLVIWRSISP